MQDINSEDSKEGLDTEGFDVIELALPLHWGEQTRGEQGEDNEKNSDRWIKHGERQPLQKPLKQY